MTEALQKMVAAMTAEVQRQCAGTDIRDAFGQSVGADLTGATLEATMERVARAGLAAIRVLPDETIETAKWWTDLFPAQIDEAFQKAVGAILKE